MGQSRIKKERFSPKPLNPSKTLLDRLCIKAFERFLEGLRGLDKISRQHIRRLFNKFSGFLLFISESLSIFAEHYYYQNRMKKILLFVTFCLSCMYVQGQELYMMGLLEDDGQYDLLPCKADLRKKDYSQLPSSHSLKAYCPKVMSQGHYGTCVGWSTAYAARSIAEAVKWGWRDQSKIYNESFSPLFVYAQIKKTHDESCSVGAQIYEALKLMKEVGSVKFSAFNTLCADYVSESLKRQAAQYRIDDYFTLFNSSSNF